MHITYHICFVISTKAWEAQLAEHGFEATGVVSSSLTLSK